ncbi:MAG: hypothetical protein IJM32_07595 [Ruminococcus sp.]|nr:hypothetical protein [Ruminococcus sp.]
MKINIVTADENKIRDLANHSAFTWEGMDLDDKNISDIAQVFCSERLVKAGKEEMTAYTWSGKVMNKMYSLTGENAYADDLPFLSFELDSFDGEGNLDVFKMYCGARWLDDIVRNNALNEQEQQG